MGNGSSKNDDFSRNPNFNMNQHSQAMATLNANYTDSNYRMGQYHAHHRTDVTETEFKAIHRTTSIYKPSLAIVPRSIVSTTSLVPSRSSLNTTVTRAANSKST
jgi:hypothetical protein